MTTMLTNTSRWSLVILRATQTSVRIWVGTLFDDMKKPQEAYIDLEGPDGTVTRHKIAHDDWKRPFRDVGKRFYFAQDIPDLSPATHYKVRFLRKTEYEYADAETEQQLRAGAFDTLPDSLPMGGTDKPFTVALGSCFYSNRDGGSAASAYRALYESDESPVKPDVTFLTGDQVYLDIGFDSLSRVKSEIRTRIANDYAQHWQLLGSILSRGATWMLPDDHEYWNDYPFYKTLIPTLWALRSEEVRHTWTRASIDGVRRVQQSPVVETFDIGTDLSFCLADLRSYRLVDGNSQGDGFLPKADFERLEAWARGLTGPGVLAIPQPLIVEENKSERNLLSFAEQYKGLIQALASSGHDIVLLSGDVHFGRIAEVPLGTRGGRLIEIIASPMSNLTGLNGIATATPKSEPTHFPDPSLAAIPDVPPAKINYDATYQVSTQPSAIFSSYPRERTSEHFMTISFRKDSDGVRVSADAWRVREPQANGLPTPDFTQSFTTVLK